MKHASTRIPRRVAAWKEATRDGNWRVAEWMDGLGYESWNDEEEIEEVGEDDDVSRLDLVGGVDY